MCISVDGTMPLGETLTEKIIDVTFIWYYRKCTIGYQKWAQMNYLHAIIIAELHVHEVRASVAPYLRKCGK